MMVRTLAEIRQERGEDPYGFVLIATGALPADAGKAAVICSWIQTAVDNALTTAQQDFADTEITGLAIRSETYEAYVAEGMPNSGAH